MGGLRGLGRLGGLRRVGVRAAPAIVGQVRRVGGRAERAFVRCLFFAYPSLIVCLSFANCSLILRLTFGERHVIWKYKIWYLSFVIYNYFVLLCADTFLSFFEYAKTFDFSN